MQTNQEAWLALDIGGGTQDLLIDLPGNPRENAYKMVMPSPTQVAAARVRRARAEGKAVFLYGELMGGGAVHRAVGEHLAAGLKVWATVQAAASLHDNLDKVRAQGVEFCQDQPPESQAVLCGDLDQEGIAACLARFELTPPKRWAVAVCDHGYAPGASNRKFRFAQWREFLAGGGRLSDLVIKEPASHLTRLAAILRQRPGTLLMDTAAAALWGGLEDPVVAAQAKEGLCLVNVGNMHTVAFLVRGGRVLGVYEHHTGCLDSAMLGRQVARFIAGDLSDDEVFDGKGHGCARLPQAPTQVAGPVALTGPRRALARELGWREAVPWGDTMLSGCFGLVAAARSAGL